MNRIREIKEYNENNQNLEKITTTTKGIGDFQPKEKEQTTE